MMKKKELEKEELLRYTCEKLSCRANYCVVCGAYLFFDVDVFLFLFVRVHLLIQIWLADWSAGWFASSINLGTRLIRSSARFPPSKLFQLLRLMSVVFYLNTACMC